MSALSKIAKKIWKIEGAGNDFVLIPNKAPTKTQDQIKICNAICRTHTGVGSDGLVFVWKEKGKGWRWEFLNSDGSYSDICGNAARAVGWWLKQVGGKKKKEWSWVGRIGEITARWNTQSKQVAVTWPIPKTEVKVAPESLLYELSGLNDRGFAGAYICQVGIPHIVLLNHENWGVLERNTTNPHLLHHAFFGEQGTNVTWVSLTSMKAVTYERGVECETQACGSGALAAYFALNAFEETEKAKRSFHFPGGTLSIEKWKNKFWLLGPAKIVMKGELTNEWINEHLK